MKLLFPATIVTFVAALLLPVATPLAAPITGLFNTGVDAAGAPLANNAAEIHYTAIAVPAGGATGVRVATSANGFPIPPWIGDDLSSAWIGPNSDAALNGPIGRYDYRVTFSLAGFVASSAFISGLWSADNEGLDIVVNGVSSGNNTGLNSDTFRSFFNFTLSSNFVGGTNTLDFIFNNDGGPTGLRVEMTGTADTAVAAVPEPTSFAILGAGLLGLRLIRRQRSQA